MKTSSTSHTTIIGAVVVLIIAAAAYFYYQGGSVPDVSGLVAEQATDVGFSEVRLLQQAQNIRIDMTLFSDPAFQALQDYSVAIPQQSVGRPNPFAPY